MQFSVKMEVQMDSHDDMNFSEADRLAEELHRQWEIYEEKISNMEELDLGLIRYGLANQFDVIVAEALDCIITLDAIDEFTDEILFLVKNNKSWIIKGRLRLCIALSKKNIFEESKMHLAKNRDSYYRIWESAAIYIETHGEKFLEKLISVANSNSKNLRHRSLANSLLKFIHEKETKCL
ncbi:hypothetical protein [Methylorubrum sp. Q1]|uniref:hypothetical protein n=1 Tax=Methylorubrum sp. Q1 TaxID=2562453 RepID=UPI001292CA04|nr:hypothetical protein [Methylorubrum sp. Q1]